MAILLEMYTREKGNITNLLYIKRVIEIIGVDDGSTDDAVKIFQMLKVTTLRQNHKGPGTARKLGARHARGNIVVLVDAAMVFATNYVSRLVTPIISGQAIAACHWNEKVSN